MALTKQTMTDEQRKSVVIEYLKAFDNGGVKTGTGAASSICSPRTRRSISRNGALPPARSRSARCSATSAVPSSRSYITYSHFNWIFSGSDLVVCEGTSQGEHRDGPWRAGVPEHGAGRWCDVFEIRDWKI